MPRRTCPRWRRRRGTLPALRSGLVAADPGVRPGLRSQSPRKKQFEELDTAGRELGFQLLGPDDFKKYKLMQDFSAHVGEILETIADTVLPQEFDRLVEWGLGDDPAGGGS